MDRIDPSAVLSSAETETCSPPGADSTPVSHAIEASSWDFPDPRGPMSAVSAPTSSSSGASPLTPVTVNLPSTV
jgi:hypothetical protein